MRCRFFFGLIFVFLVGALAPAEELPVPTYRNSLIIAIEHNVGDSAEIDYIKSNFKFGLYAWPSFSHTHLDPALDWHASLSDASAGIQSFKTTFDSLLAAAKAKKVGLHVVVCSGLSRSLAIYREAKQEDIRNAQWFNDNNLAADDQITSADAFDRYIFGTLSRYARKPRANLKAKSRAALAFLKQKIDENPDVLITLSGWGEAELNNNRIQHDRAVQDWFCDYSPFAVLEFRDWIQHAGMYDDAVGIYKGQGYGAGGAAYQGAEGLVRFNANFGTTFTTWDLRYFHWSLADDYDSIPEDGENNDPHKISFSQYVHGGMKPESGPGFTAGGFDPPRTMQPGNSFWELWRQFRETMVHHFVLDLANWVAESGIAAERWYTHQIPADYLFGTAPGITELNARYYSSASPLRTADALPHVSVGATIYDIKFPTWFARTTQYILPNISAISSNWAILEYDPEVYPTGSGVSASDADFILSQIIRVYDYSPHLLNFWRWEDTPVENQIKGMNKEIAIRSFVQRVRDKARRTDLNTVFDPPKVIGVSGRFVAAETALEIQLSGNIWNGPAWKWKDWGDFSFFEVFRGDEPDFPVNEEHKIATTAEYTFKDGNVHIGRIYYYKIQAVNVSGVHGPASDAILLVTAANDAPILNVGKTRLNFGAQEGQTGTPAQIVMIQNIGPAGSVLSWTAAADSPWISVNPAAGTGNGVITVSVNAAGLAAGTFIGRVTVADPLAVNSPKQITINLEVFGGGMSSGPFGFIDTPISGRTVFGSVAVTGWALDDIQVTGVKIYRNPVGNEPTHPNGYVFLGDAMFIDGARPDVEQVYPTYPLNSRAGWGLMMLTNFLPNGGNGPFVIYAEATDKEGNTVELGAKVINCDNASSVLPFGAIDTPTQGGTASGNDFVNFGWALTPVPNIIPPDGSTLYVWIDGVPIGHPTYNNYRSDIATLFPGYANSNGAVGFFHLDTTAYVNGIHTIQWSVRDSAGNENGIGSRYFMILNSGAGSPTALPFRLSTPRFIEDAAADIRAAFYETWKTGMIPAGTAPVFCCVGYNLKSPAAALFPDSSGWAEISMEEAGRVEILLDERSLIDRQMRDGRAAALIGDGRKARPLDNAIDRSWSAYLAVGNELRPLPVGSTFDPQRGVLSWQPGPGFLGEYSFVFLRRSASGELDKKLVKIRIDPKQTGGR